MMRISLDVYPDASQKGGRFSKTLLEKGLQFDPSRRDGTVAFNLGLVLLPTEVNFILEEQSRKKNAFRACGTSYVEMILTLSIEVGSSTPCGSYHSINRGSGP